LLRNSLGCRNYTVGDCVGIAIAYAILVPFAIVLFGSALFYGFVVLPFRRWTGL
jgi:hypothetical protein